MKTHLIASVGWPDVYHRVGVVGDGEMNRFLHQTGELFLEMDNILPIELFHAVTQVDSRLWSCLLPDFSVHF